MKSKELREKRAKIAAGIKKLAELANKESRDFNDAEKPNWDKANADYDVLTRQIEIAERAEAVDAEQGARRDLPPIGKEDRDFEGGTRRGEATEEQRALAMQAWMRNLCDLPISQAQSEACGALGLNPAARRLTLPLARTGEMRRIQRAFALHRGEAQERALSAITLATGGALVPETLLRSLETNMLAFGGIMQVAEILRTATGEKMSWPTADDTSNSGEQIGESGSIGSSVDPSFGLVQWDAYKFSSKVILVPHELLEDSAFELASWLGSALGERLGRIKSSKFTTGSGAGTPKGIVTAATLGVTAASASAIAADELIDLEHSVNSAYRQGAGFLMADGTVKTIRKLKDGNGQYLWQTGMQSGAPDRILNYPVTVSHDMAAIATTAKTILFGQLSKYKVREVGAIRLYRLEERYRDNDQDGFIAFSRADGNLLDAGTAPVKYLQQA